MALNAKTITNKEYFYGHKACGGCGAACRAAGGVQLISVGADLTLDVVGDLGVVLQKLHNFFAWGHGCSSNHPRVIRFGCGAAG